MDDIVLPNLYPLTILFSILALSFRPSILRTASTVGVAAYLAAQVGRRPETIPSDDYATNCSIWLVLIGQFDRIVLANPDRENWHKVKPVEAKEGTTQITDTPPRSFLDRLVWSSKIHFLPRGYGWSQQVKSIPPAPPAGYPKWLEAAHPDSNQYADRMCQEIHCYPARSVRHLFHC
jgi:hypothetical protein